MKLEKLLTSRWRGFIRRLAEAFDLYNIQFAVIGAMALGKQTSRVRSTEDIDIIVKPEAKAAVYKAVAAAGLLREAGTWPLVRFTDGTLAVDVLAGAGDPEESALEMAVPVELFGTSVRIITRVFMLWMYLLSNQPKHHDDALNVIRAMPSAELRQLRMYLAQTGDSDAVRLLNRWETEARS